MFAESVCRNIRQELGNVPMVEVFDAKFIIKKYVIFNLYIRCCFAVMIFNLQSCSLPSSNITLTILEFKFESVFGSGCDYFSS